jgi:hypothetical protein
MIKVYDENEDVYTRMSRCNVHTYLIIHSLICISMNHVNFDGDKGKIGKGQ